MNDPERGRTAGRKAARYFGAEFQANPGDSMADHRYNMAWYYGHKSWSEMLEDERTEAMELFEAGKKAEKACQRQRERNDHDQ